MTKILLKNNELYEPTEELLKLWQIAYPYIDVRRELDQIAAWNWANPPKRKTLRGINRHINTWLMRSNSEVQERVDNEKSQRFSAGSWSRHALGATRR